MRRYTRSIFLTIALAAPLTPMAEAQMRPPIALTATEFASAPIGGAVQIIIRVAGRERTTLHGELLNRKTDQVYTTTGKHVDVYLTDETPVVMGSISDVAPGAVIFVFGVVTAKYHADAKRFIVVTNDVRIVSSGS